MMDSVLVAALVLAFGPTVLRAVVTGSISGTARDASGAVVPGVTVKARNTWTGVVQTLQTDSWQRDVQNGYMANGANTDEGMRGCHHHPQPRLDR
jgi:hypothetical protein